MTAQRTTSSISLVSCRGAANPIATCGILKLLATIIDVWLVFWFVGLFVCCLLEFFFCGGKQDNTCYWLVMSACCFTATKLVFIFFNIDYIVGFVFQIYLTRGDGH